MSSIPPRSEGPSRPLLFRETMRRFGSPSSLSLSARSTDHDNRASPEVRISKWWFAAALAPILWIPGHGSAQQATYFWGTVVEESGRGAASSEMHLNSGISAGQVNAARDGILYQGSTISILSIGSQSVISTSIVGDNNSVDVNADQNTSNSGDVSNSGSVTFSTVKEEG